MKTQAQAAMLANRLQKRFRHLKKWAARTGTCAFRLYDKDIPEIPLVLDFYGLTASEASDQSAIAGALYKRPYEKDEKEEEKWLSSMKESISAALSIKPSHIFLKQRERQKGLSQYEKASRSRFEKVIIENGLSFKVNLSDYLDTGLFLDRRLLRAHIRAQSQGKRVLNLFSYTGSFSIYAASGGAASTTSIDLSNTYLDWTKENFELNGFKSKFERIQTQSTQSNAKKYINFQNSAPSAPLRLCARYSNSLIRADVLKFLEKAVTLKDRWDIIILDPPAFSNSKKMEGNFDLKRDLNTLVNYCIYLLARGGKLFLSINTRYSFDKDWAVDLSLAPRLADMRITDLTEKMRDEDFGGKKIPKTFLFEM